jgi:hypothetical protein
MVLNNYLETISDNVDDEEIADTVGPVFENIRLSYQKDDDIDEGVKRMQTVTTKYGRSVLESTNQDINEHEKELISDLHCPNCGESYK